MDTLTLRTHAFRLRKIPLPYAKYRLTPRKSGRRVMLSLRRIMGPLFFLIHCRWCCVQRYKQQFVALLEMYELDCWFIKPVQPTTLLMRPWTCSANFLVTVSSLKSSGHHTPVTLPRRILFLWVHLKERAYKCNPRTLNDLMKAISQGIKNITPTMLRRFSGSVWNRVQLCLQENGGHFQ
jgi:hypothetical protein